MTASIKNVNNDFKLVRVGLPQAITRAERLQANNREIAKLENELSIRKDNINATKALIASNNETINILEQLKSNGEKLLDSHIQARDASMKVVEANDKMFDLMQQMIAVMEKMVAIMEKNPAKHGGLANLEIQKQPEVIEAKNQVTELTNKKVAEYPLNMHIDLKETTKKVIDATFSEIKSDNPQANRKLFSNLSYRLEVALDKKYELLARNKPAKEFMNSVDRFLDIFSKIQNLSCLDLNIKNIKT